MGFDNIEAGQYHTPSLTTVSPDKPAIARLAVERLLAARLAGDTDEAPVEFWAGHELIVRESTAAR